MINFSKINPNSTTDEEEGLKDKIDELMEKNFRFDPCYLPAVLKLSTQLKGEKIDKLDDLLDESLSEFSISHEDFERYIDAHRGELEEEARKLSF
jgi:hypothetical protein